jgi:prepilin-type N-terminal cleavage/methylation domain-containing protein
VKTIRARCRAFTIIEMMIVLFVFTVLVSGLMVPIATQVALRRYEDTRRQMDEAKEAILGFAVANGRLPCPASASSKGLESFAPGGDALNGLCSNFHDGYLPGASLGLAPLDTEGYVRDAWGTPSNRIRYAAFAGTIGSIANALTRVNGAQASGLAALGSAPHYLWICASGLGATATGCGAASNQLTRRAAFVLLSLGPNATQVPNPGSDEARNLDASPVFVSHEISAAPGNEFDDQLTWVPASLLVSRLLAAGRLP